MSERPPSAAARGRCRGCCSGGIRRSSRRSRRPAAGSRGRRRRRPAASSARALPRQRRAAGSWPAPSPCRRAPLHHHSWEGALLRTSSSSPGSSPVPLRKFHALRQGFSLMLRGGAHVSPAPRQCKGYIWYRIGASLVPVLRRCEGRRPRSTARLLLRQDFDPEALFGDEVLHRQELQLERADLGVIAQQ